jgi:hypothetical protein
MLSAEEDDNFEETSSPLTEAVLDWIGQFYSLERFAVAKEAFFAAAGKVFPDDPIYNQRMEYFLEYFVFQRPFEIPIEGIANVTPYELFARLGRKPELCVIDSVRHSIFEILKVKEDQITITDLLIDERLTVHQVSKASIFEIIKKELFQGFVFFNEGTVTLGRGLIFHPKQVNKIIRKNLKKAMKKPEGNGEESLFALARQQLKSYRHHNVHPKQIYQLTF